MRPFLFIDRSPLNHPPDFLDPGEDSRFLLSLSSLSFNIFPRSSLAYAKGIINNAANRRFVRMTRISGEISRGVGMYVVNSGIYGPGSRYGVINFVSRGGRKGILKIRDEPG